MGLFIGQSTAFFTLLKELAQAADAARHGELERPATLRIIARQVNCPRKRIWRVSAAADRPTTRFSFPMPGVHATLG